ncbi:MAG: YebC/PmpR family DNA-binding transcriptional regulator [Patescibacteria group bacterium]|mgnify:CR=1 FL=1
MAGHSHWAGIKHKKGAADQKRGQLFAKLLMAISVAAKSEPNPEFNPRLRTAVLQAKDSSVPKEKIDAAIKRAAEASQNLEELSFEAYGPGGTAIMIEAIGDSRNRTVAEVKKILSEAGGKWAEPGSVRWAFTRTDANGQNTDANGNFTANFLQELNDEDKNKLRTLVEALEEHDDVQKVYTNAR